MFVLTADQIGSRTQPDLVDETVAALSRHAAVRPFARTVGDELQGLLDDPVSVVAATLDLMRTSQWHLGIGIGLVEDPIPSDVRAARGPAFLAARAAVERAKHSPARTAVVSATEDDPAAADAEAVLNLLAALWSRRTAEGWAAVDLLRSGHTQAEAADRLEVSRQAVSQRLAAAQWAAERDAVPVVARALARADRTATGSTSSVRP